MTLFVNNIPTTEVIDYSDFQKYLKAGKVVEVTISGDAITGELSEKLSSCTTSFPTRQVAPDLAAELSRRYRRSGEGNGHRARHGVVLRHG